MSDTALIVAMLTLGSFAVCGGVVSFALAACVSRSVLVRALMRAACWAKASARCPLRSRLCAALPVAAASAAVCGGLQRLRRLRVAAFVSWPG